MKDGNVAGEGRSGEVKGTIRGAGRRLMSACGEGGWVSLGKGGTSGCLNTEYLREVYFAFLCINFAEHTQRRQI